MTDTPETFETKTVRAVRGLESRTISKWEGEGWEFVSQSTGKLQTELVFRRPKPKSRALLYGIIGGAAAVVLAIIIGIGVATEGDSPGASSAAESVTSTAADSSNAADPEESSAPEPSVVEETEEPAETTEPATTSAEGTEESAPPVLTPETSAELRTVLELDGYCDSSIADFATEFKGRTISFDASIDAMDPHDGASTRYDILLSAGDYSETASRGPVFQFRDVNTTYDLHYSGDVPSSIGVGTNISVTAEVGEYESGSCLLLLEPVETVFR